MNKYKQFNAYKDTHLPWCPRIPCEWSLIPNKGLLIKRKDVVGSAWNQFTMLSLTKKGVIVRDVENASGKFSSDMSGYQRVKSGDLIFCLFDIEETPRTVGLSNEDGMITGAYTVLNCKNQILAKFFEMFYIAMDDGKFLSYMYSGLRNTIRPPVFLSLKTPVPSEVEMEKIIKFVKSKIVIIDKMINKKQKLVKLLQEKRQALITQAITKGCDSKVSMKDSRVKWMGEIPESWKIYSIKNLLSSSLGIKIGPFGSQLKLDDMVINGFKVYGQENVTYKNWELGTRRISQEKFNTLSVYKIRGDDVLVTMMGTIGNSIVVPKVIDLGIMDSHLIRLRLNQELILPEFLVQNFLNNVVTKSEVEYLSNGSTMSGLNSKIIKSLTISLPPLEEQEKLLSYVEKINRTTETIIKKTKRQIGKLDEFKSALIYNAVTGKIKV